MIIRRSIAAVTLLAATAGTTVGFAASAEAATRDSTGVLCAKVAKKAGFSRNQAVTAVAIALGESGCNTGATHKNRNGSVDRGLWQINSKAHKDVSASCAFDAQCNANAAYRISSKGKNFKPWSVYKSGTYKKFLTTAKKAVDKTY